MKAQKNSYFFSELQVITVFTFNLRFLYELKYKVSASKTVCGIFHSRFRFVFIKVNIFVQKMHGLFDFKGATKSISRIIRLRSLFCSIRVYVSLHFLPILLEN